MPGSRYDASTKAKAIRLVGEHAGDYPTQWAAMKAVSGRLGMSTETLRKWIRQAEVDKEAMPRESPGHRTDTSSADLSQGPPGLSCDRQRDRASGRRREID